MYEPYSDLRHIKTRSLLLHSLCHRWSNLSAVTNVGVRGALTAWRLARATSAWISSQPCVLLKGQSSWLNDFLLLVEVAWTGALVRSTSARLSWLRLQFERLEEQMAFVRSSSMSKAVNELLERHQQDVRDINSVLRRAVQREANCLGNDLLATPTE